ncbi:hypothetical protein DTL21_27740 [Bremerella cremea]|uniref:DUF3150 domain-containing protein n=3 Tax=Pirellulales TaxID=2691354 RepID=A0A2S8FCF1_9BACT|nr:MULTISPECIES: hypothetical protein [Pirellulaceae]PQO29829.1 hypothetical protein C5Y83_27695 [Blastopirellula marina]RCS43131.1 hypothetical protein DTL21_27740 [Bremerella cremea]
MTATILEQSSQETITSASLRMRSTMCATRVNFVWFGTQKTLTRAQKDQAAESFDAQGEFLRAEKKLLDTKNPRFKAVNSVRNAIRSVWSSMSLPFPEPATRLIRRDMVPTFQNWMEEQRERLQETVQALDEDYAALKDAARQRLGRLYNEADYPHALRGLFEVSWDFPNVEVPPYLRLVDPQLYETECERVQARFDEAVEMAESAFIEELSELVSHLTDRLSGSQDGRTRIFRDSAIGNLNEFFERFRSLNIRSNDQLDELVSDCQRIVQGVQPQALRDNANLRQSVSRELSSVQSVLDELLVDRPRRRIIRTLK